MSYLRKWVAEPRHNATVLPLLRSRPGGVDPEYICPAQLLNKY